VGKFILNLSSSNSSIFTTFMNIFNNWKYVNKTLPIISSVISSFSFISPVVYHSPLRFKVVEAPFLALITNPLV